MRKILMLAILIGILGFPVQADEPAKNDCVILISVDGLANFYLDDPHAQLPTIRSLAKSGARADGGMVCAFPTVTWPNHTTLVTGVSPGKHGVIGNNYLDREKVKSIPFIPDPLFDKSEIVKVPTIYDVAHEAGLKTAGIIWPATRNAKTLDWTVPDMAGPDAWPNYATPTWLKELREAGLPVDSHGTWTKESSGGVRRDWLYTRLLDHVIDHHSPNLVLIHLVEVDHVEHQFGPRSPEAYWAVSIADDRVRDIVEAVKQSPRADRTTVIVASDHGFFPISRDIRPNVLFKKLQSAETKLPRIRSVSQGGACQVYVLDAKDKDKEIAELKNQLSGIEGVERVFTTDEFAELGQAIPSEDPRAPDLWMTAKSGYSFTDNDSGDDIVVPRAKVGGTHGYLPSQPDLHATLVMWGHGIRKGVDLGRVSNLDVAPTIAKLLGVSLPTADGKVLTKALAE
jgi:predicted AlkP superfamily pyrophosphatase or phosphodiesterase